MSYYFKCPTCEHPLEKPGQMGRSYCTICCDYVLAVEVNEKKPNIDDRL